MRTANLSPEEYAAVITACSHKDFLTVKEAALYFGVGLYRLRAMANSEIGEAFTVQCGPRQRLISREKFKKFMEDKGYKVEEIAGMIGKSASAVKMRLQKGRKLLKEAYRKE